MEAKFICLDEPDFFELIERVVARVKDQHGITYDEYISMEKAMEVLDIKSKTTFLELRDQGCFSFSYITDRIIQYETASIYEYRRSKTSKNI